MLDAEQVREIAKIAAAVEQHYGAPQDLEFAVEDDHVWLVQTRPITTLRRRRRRAVRRSRWWNRAPLVRGLGAGPGTATGTARVLTALEDSGRLGDGDILVAR